MNFGMIMYGGGEGVGVILHQNIYLGHYISCTWGISYTIMFNRIYPNLRPQYLIILIILIIPIILNLWGGGGGALLISPSLGCDGMRCIQKFDTIYLFIDLDKLGKTCHFLLSFIVHHTMVQNTPLSWSILNKY